MRSSFEPSSIDTPESVADLRHLKLKFLRWRHQLIKDNIPESVQETQSKVRIFRNNHFWGIADVPGYQGECKEIIEDTRLKNLQQVCLRLEMRMASLEASLLEVKSSECHVAYKNIIGEINKLVCKMIKLPASENPTYAAQAEEKTESLFEHASYPSLVKEIQELNVKVAKLPSSDTSGVGQQIIQAFIWILKGLMVLVKSAFYGLGAGVVGLAAGAAVGSLGGPAGAVAGAAMGAVKGAAIGAASAACTTGGVMGTAAAVPAALGTTGTTAAIAVTAYQACKGASHLLFSLFAPDPVKKQFNNTLTAVQDLALKTCTKM